MKVINTVFYVGLLPFGATIATVLGLITGYVYSSWIVFFIVTIISIYTVSKNPSHDPKTTVIDEFLGSYFMLLFVDKNPQNLIMSLIFFRLFDILKPWPIRLFDKGIKNSFGVIFDDILASAYSLLLITVITWIIKQ